jgi:hypothetical protein
MTGFARWMRLGLAALMIVMSSAHAYAQSTDPADAKAPRLKANPAIEECHRRALALVDTAARRNKEGGEVVGHLLFGFGIAGAVYSAVKNEDDKQKAIAATEQACLASKGLAPKVTDRKAVVYNKNTAPGSEHTCMNPETSCTHAHTYCMNACAARKATSRCTNDCEQAGRNCSLTGTWKTTNCLKTGMIK